MFGNLIDTVPNNLYDAIRPMIFTDRSSISALTMLNNNKIATTDRLTDFIAIVFLLRLKYEMKENPNFKHIYQSDLVAIGND